MRRQGCKGSMVLKLDFSKAYYRLEWSFIQGISEDASLPPILVAIIMQCVTSGDYRVLWNGEASESFHPSQGLRQRDPLSPYLFVLCMEWLAQWIVQATNSNSWRHIKASCRGPSFSHLFFADDVLFFSEATKQQAAMIRKGLIHFCRAFGAAG